jgi:hypothetical protein
MKHPLCRIALCATVGFAAVPHTFTKGSPAVAEDINDNFRTADSLIRTKAENSIVTALASAMNAKADASLKDSLKNRIDTASFNALSRRQALDTAAIAALSRKQRADSSTLAGQFSSFAGKRDPNAIPVFDAKGNLASSSLVDDGKNLKTALPFTAPYLFGKLFPVDDRKEPTYPNSTDQGVSFNFKYQSIEGLNEGSNYFGEMTFRPYGGKDDFSGGPTHQLAFTPAGNICQRYGSTTKWSAWRRLAYSGEVVSNQGGTIHGDLQVAGKLTTRPDIPVADYVFDPDYKLSPLSEVESYTRENHHLPEIPSAAEIEKGGMDLARMNVLLLKKVEELTLHAIEQEKSLNTQADRNAKLEKTISDLAGRLEALEKR